MSEKIRSYMWVFYLLCFLIFAFIFPRILTSNLGPENPWTNYLYTYGFGFFYSGSGILLIYKSGACNLNRVQDLFWFKILVGGWFYFASLHALWIYLALSIPYKGAI